MAVGKNERADDVVSSHPTAVETLRVLSLDAPYWFVAVVDD